MKGTPMKTDKALLRQMPMPLPRAAIHVRRHSKRAIKTVYRSPGLLSLAIGKNCTLMACGLCLGHSDPVRTKIVVCRSNRSRHGKAGHVKAHNWEIAFGCAGPHFYLDQLHVLTDEKVRHFELGLTRIWQTSMTMGKWPAEVERGSQRLYGGVES